MADDTKSLEIQILTKYFGEGAAKALVDQQKLAATVGTGSDVTGKLKTATEELGEAQKTGAGHANILHENHQALHKILHLIAKESGPQAGFALAAIGSAGGGGVMLAVMAAGLLVESLKQAHEATEKLNEKAREAFVAIQNESAAAAKSIDATGEAMDKFWQGLSRKTAVNQVKTDFDEMLQRIKDVATAAEASGFISKEQAGQFVSHREFEAKGMRAAELEEAVRGLTIQLKELQAKMTGGDALKQQIAIESAKADLENAKNAIKLGEGYSPKSSILPGGFSPLHSGYRGDTANEQQLNYLAEAGAAVHRMEEKIKSAEANNPTKEHAELLQNTITRMSDEAARLRGDNTKTVTSEATSDFFTGAKIAQNPGAATAEQKQFLIVLEQTITGHKQSWTEAVRLMNLQSTNVDTATVLVANMAGKIAQVQRRLDQLTSHTNLP